MLSSGFFDVYSGKRIETQENSSGKKGSGATLTRAQLYMSDKPDKNASRNGEDYALLFANDKYDNREWSTLKNPKNDVRDIAKELKEKYGFKGVDIRENLTTQEIYDTILRVFSIAGRDGVPSFEAADRLAEERIRSVAALKDMWVAGDR